MTRNSRCDPPSLIPALFDQPKLKAAGYEQCRILSQAPIHVINPFQTAKSLHTSLDRSRAFEAALQDLVSWWWRSFEVDLSIPGLQSVTFAKAVAAQPVPELPLDSDTWLTEKQKRKILAKIPGDHIRGAKSLSLRAVEMAGSRDMSTQLFVALCTALDLPARLVVSLQPLDWRSSGSTTSTVEDEEASQAESTTTAGGKGKAHNKSKAKRSSDVKNKAKETGASKLAKKAGLAAQASASRFGHRTKTMEKALTDNDSDIEMEEVSISSPRPGGFLTEQADVSETLRHAGPSPSLRRSKPKLKDFQRSPSPGSGPINQAIKKTGVLMTRMSNRCQRYAAQTCHVGRDLQSLAQGMGHC